MSAGYESGGFFLFILEFDIILFGKITKKYKTD